VLIADTQPHAEDQALEAAHSDRREGKTALVVVQTSNEHLDGLNARAQALRVQDDELGEREVALTGRPYGLRSGDEIVLRAASVHPRLGAVRNGTRGTVLAVAADEQHATVQLGDGREVGWDRGQLDAASARLGYVSHTFPAQGQTVDRAHVIAGEHADANGTYVALTRARESTWLYASTERLDAGDQDGAGGKDRLARLADRLGRSEPEVPSIAVALAHEQRVERELDEQSAPSPPRRPDRRPDSDDDVSRRQGSERERREQQRARLDQARVERDQAAAALEHARVERDQTARVIATCRATLTCSTRSLTPRTRPGRPNMPPPRPGSSPPSSATWDGSRASGSAGGHSKPSSPRPGTVNARQPNASSASSRRPTPARPSSASSAVRGRSSTPAPRNTTTLRRARMSRPGTPPGRRADLRHAAHPEPGQRHGGRIARCAAAAAAR